MAKRRKRVNQKHPLAEWLRLNEVTQKQFADMAHMTPGTVHKIMDLNGSQLSFLTLWKINWATDGVVSPTALRHYERYNNRRNSDFIQHFHTELWGALDTPLVK